MKENSTSYIDLEHNQNMCRLFLPTPPPPSPTIPFRFQKCWRELLGDILGVKETLELIVLGKLGYNLENRNVTISDVHVMVTVLLLMSSRSEHFHAKMHGFERARNPNTHVVSMCRAHFSRVVAVTWPNNFNDAIAPWLLDKSSNILFIFADLTVFCMMFRLKNTNKAWGDYLKCGNYYHLDLFRPSKLFTNNMGSCQQSRGFHTGCGLFYVDLACNSYWIFNHFDRTQYSVVFGAVKRANVHEYSVDSNEYFNQIFPTANLVCYPKGKLAETAPCMIGLWKTETLLLRSLFYHKIDDCATSVRVFFFPRLNSRGKLKAKYAM